MYVIWTNACEFVEVFRCNMLINLRVLVQQPQSTSVTNTRNADISLTLFDKNLQCKVLCFQALCISFWQNMITDIYPSVDQLASVSRQQNPIQNKHRILHFHAARFINVTQGEKQQDLMYLVSCSNIPFFVPSRNFVHTFLSNPIYRCAANISKSITSLAQLLSYIS